MEDRVVIRVVEVLEATVGGTRKHLRALVAALPAEQYEVRVVCSTRRDPSYRDDIAEFRRDGRRVYELPMTRGPHPVIDPVAVVRLRRLLRREPCDILHLHSAKAGWLGRIAARGLDCKVIYTPHAFPFLQRGGLSTPTLYRWAERCTADRVDLLLAVGQSEADVAIRERLFPPDRVCVVPNAIDVDDLTRCVGRADGASTGVPTVGLVAELRKQKDPLTFLRAVKRLARSRVRARFVMPMCGSLLGSARRYVRDRGLDDVVEFVPTSYSMHDLYRVLDYAVLPSLWEGLPYTLLESLALGLPTIGSSIAPIREVVEPLDPGLLFPPGDADALARRIAEWIEKPREIVADVSARAREHIARAHGMDAWREQIRAVYGSLV